MHQHGSSQKQETSQQSAHLTDQVASLSLSRQPISSSSQDAQIVASASSASGEKAAISSLDPKLLTYRTYGNEDDIPIIMELIAPYLSEPYSIYCYRYFLHGWPQLCILTYYADTPVGVIVCKQDVHRGKLMRGYIAMLATKPEYRKLGIATTLVEKAIDTMKREGAQEIVLETEVSNEGALRLYERLGFIRLKRLYRFYLNASDAFRLLLPIPEDEWQIPPQEVVDRMKAPLPPELQEFEDAGHSSDEDGHYM